MYNRLCFTRDSTIAGYKKLIRAGLELPPTPDPDPPVQREPSTTLQRLFVSSMQDAIDCAGETMPHLHDIHPEDEDLPESKQRTHERIYLPCGMVANQIELVREFVKANKLPPMDDDKLVYVAHKLWKKFFWWVYIKKWIPFAMCDQCMTLFATLMAAKTAEERNEIKLGRQEHRDRCTTFRKNHELRMMLGLQHPDEFLSMIVDGMDNQKTQLPRVEGKLYSKTLNNVGEFLATKLLGILTHGYGFYGGWCLPRYEGGSSLICTALLRVIQIIREQRGGSLPPVLLLQADNCGRENKNQYMVAFLGWLIKAGYFREIRLSFLPVGHTHSIIDQRFSQVHKKIQNRVILDPEEMIDIVLPLFKDDGFVTHEMIEDIVDFKKFFGKSRYELQGLGTMRTALDKGRSIHAMRITKDEDGDPAFTFKEWDSSSVEWTGDWKRPDRAIKIFKSYDFEDDFTVLPRMPIANLDKVKEKWTAIASFCRVKLEDPDDSDLDKLLHSTAVRANSWWMNFFHQEEQYWAVRSSSGQQDSRTACESPTSKRARAEGDQHTSVTSLDEEHESSLRRFVSARSEVNEDSSRISLSTYVVTCFPLLVLVDNCSNSTLNESIRLMKHLPEPLADAFYAAAEAEEVIGDECKIAANIRPLSVSHKGDKILNREVFNPSVHVKEEDIVLLSSNGDFSSTNGWELARVKKIHRSMDPPMLDIVYVLPSSLKKFVIRTGDNVGKCTKKWGDFEVWSRQKLVDWPLQRSTVWGDQIGFDSIWWGFTPTTTGIVRSKTKDKDILKAQIQRIQTCWKKISPNDREGGVVPKPPRVRTDPERDPLTTFGTHIDDDPDD